MFRGCCCCVLWEKPRRRCTHRLPLDHPKAIFLIDFDSGQRFTERVCHPFIVDELMKDGQGLSTASGTHSYLPHRSRQGCNFSSRAREVVVRHTSPRTLPSEWAEHFGSRPLADHT